METMTLKQMKHSEIHRIVAAVLEVMEKARFETQVDVALQVCDNKEAEEEQPEKWKMVFQKKSTDLDELIAIKGELGQNFKVKIDTKDKMPLLISIEAPSTDFIALLQKKQAQPIPSRTMFDTTAPNNQEQKQ